MTSLFPLSQINSTVSLPGGGAGPPEDVKPPVLGVRGLHCPPPPGGPGAGKRLCAICGDRSSGMGLSAGAEEESAYGMFTMPVGFPRVSEAGQSKEARGTFRCISDTGGLVQGF